MEIASGIQLGARIKSQRKALGMTQEDLAAKAGVSRTWVNQVEKGKESASFQLVLRTLNSLGLGLTAVERKKGKELMDLVFNDL